MKKSINLIFILLVASNVIFSQEKLFTLSGALSFFSETPVENIEAINHQASCLTYFSSDGRLHRGRRGEQIVH